LFFYNVRNVLRPRRKLVFHFSRNKSSCCFVLLFIVSVYYHSSSISCIVISSSISCSNTSSSIALIQRKGFRALLRKMALRCSKCLNSIADSTAFWKFDETGCGHTLCSQCFTSFALDVKKECPCCHVIPHSIVHSYFIWHGRGIHKRLIKKNHTSTLAHTESANLLTISVLDELPITVSLKAP